jgi:hypothetical protein
LTNPVDDGIRRRITNLPKESKQVLEQTTKAEIGEEFMSLCKWVQYFFSKNYCIWTWGRNLKPFFSPSFI